MLQAVAKSLSAPTPKELSTRPAGPHAIEAAEEDELFLLGRPPIAEDLGFLTSQVVGPDRADAREIADAWRAANDVIVTLQSDEAGWADDPSLLELPPQLVAARDRLMTDGMFRRSMEVVPVDVKMVPLDRLVVPQKTVTLSSVERLTETFAGDRDPRSIFDVCLPLERPREPVRCLRVSNDSFVFASPSHDFRFLETNLLDPAQVAGEPMRGLVTNVIGLAVGYSCNCLTALHVRNRLVLVNGTHRALALLKMGMTHAPCVVQSISRPEELTLLAPRELIRNQGEFLGSSRPILLKDFLDPRLCLQVRVSRRTRQVKVTFNIETVDAPYVQ